MNKVIYKIMYVVPANELGIIAGSFITTLAMVFIFEYVMIWGRL